MQNIDFFCHRQDNFPSNHLLDVSWLRYQHENNIDLNYKIFTALNDQDRFLNYAVSQWVEANQSKLYNILKIIVTDLALLILHTTLTSVWTSSSLKGKVVYVTYVY